LTYNRAADGTDTRERYYADKRRSIDRAKKNIGGDKAIGDDASSSGGGGLASGGISVIEHWKGVSADPPTHKPSSSSSSSSLEAASLGEELEEEGTVLESSEAAVEATLDELRQWYDGALGASWYDDTVTQREHALQTAALAEEAGAAENLVAACLLHDVGECCLSTYTLH
jgi:hypothetical protein